MENVLRDFLKPLRAEAQEDAHWIDSSLRMSCYLHDTMPPLEFVTSVRAIVLTSEGVAVLHNPNEAHVIPGGRIEDGENLISALRREVAEETGCRLGDPVYIGFTHFEHQTPKPEGYPYPYPDFIQVVYASRGDVVGEPADPTGWEQRVEFVPVKDVRARVFSKTQTVFLEAGLRILGAIAA